ncbi:phenoloxidase-activating factor 2-like [Anopheles aquasalis]|uniref:phenoloxidase-activating factor 2-like n=1 Tax=Anopheles aquasalis TaxID=42839 RepID=UPI00215B4A64|nr:phenoloxidase-activating factor 2-like [Anopheles aquasalis]
MDQRWWWYTEVSLTVLLLLLNVNRSVRADARCPRENEICVPTENCLYGVVNEGAVFFMMPRFGGDDDECEDEDQVCCKKVPVKPNPYSLPEQPTERPVVVVEDSESLEDEQSDWSEQCGKNSNVTESAGFLANRWEFPWSVAIFRSVWLAGKWRNVFLCGGTLLEDHTILTTVECVRHQLKASLRVHVGRWDLGNTDEKGKKVLEVEEVVLHPDYKPSSKQNNIALLFLADNVRFGSSVNRVCLAEREHRYDVEHLCYTVGWGTKFVNEVKQLQKLKTFLALRNDCQESIRRYTSLSKFELSPADVCTEAVDTIDGNYPCARITGSGLVCAKGNQQHFLVGIASYSLRKCSNASVNDVFVDVRQYTEWIDGHVRARHGQPGTYRPDPVFTEK